MMLINTRPLSRGDQLAADLSLRGVDVTHLPMLALYPLALSTDDLKSLSDLSAFNIIIVVSPTAATLALDQLVLGTTALKEITWIAVGQKTATVLQQHGIQTIISPSEAINTNSEGVIDLLLQHNAVQLRSKTTPVNIMLWRGQTGRTLIQQTISNLEHVSLTEISLYGRSFPPTSAQTWLNIRVQLSKMPVQSAAVLITSTESWANWLALESIVPEQFTYIVLGQRIAKHINDTTHHNPAALALTHIKIIEKLDAETIYSALHS